MPVARRLAEHGKLIFTGLKSLKPQAGTVNHPFGDIGGILKPQPLPPCHAWVISKTPMPSHATFRGFGWKSTACTHTHTQAYTCALNCSRRSFQSPSAAKMAIRMGEGLIDIPWNQWNPKIRAFQKKTNVLPTTAKKGTNLNCLFFPGTFEGSGIVLFSFETSATGSPGNYLYTFGIISNAHLRISLLGSWL